MTDNRNLVLAIAISLAIFLGWEYFVAAPQMKADQARQALLHREKAAAPSVARSAPAAPQHLGRAEALKRGGARIAIDTPSVDGSLLLKGARLDDLRLKNYRESVDPKSPEIVLLSPEGSQYPYYAAFGFTTQAKFAVPTGSTTWTPKDNAPLTPSHPVTLNWDNGHGLVFTRIIAVDDKFMFTVTDTVANNSGAVVSLQPYAYVARDGVPPTQKYWVLHEGFVGVGDGSLKDPSYDDFKDDTPPKTFNSTGGWVGITDKYWMATLIPPQNQPFQGVYSAASGGAKHYQADYRLDPRSLAAGSTLSVTHRLFAGAKVFDIIKNYEHRLNIARFDLAIDWGWFIIITQPLFWLLNQLFHLLGNFGLAILALTVVVKLVFFPIANAQYKSMAKMKLVQPEMERIKERFKEDPQKQQQAMMELYRREKVNPVAGCLPMLLIIPVFFSLYKVIFVTIELRHAPFYGWIRDLSAPDPTSLINLFGLLPFNPHAVLPSFLGFLSIGIWPVLMGVTQWLQTKLNPAPADPVQAKMFSYMPLIFTFMFATFPSGLVIYYAWNNLLSVVQQYVMMRRQGADVHLVENLKPPAWLRQRLARGSERK
ncbi:MAG: membrane protein insertase YidC [Alphaproteobacteria bacterium]|nr:membrane protein insertase YidC [Alphaproteobacteria bacterium]MBV9694097.1 membrane protein insertase YidC [Alphaproteobacteria bacterium]